jgi:hypothetical protein
MTACKHPEITVKLVGGDGNAFSILGSVIPATRAAKLPDEEIRQFRDEAMSGGYDHLLQTCVKWVEVQ